ncbi:hypothetical protein Taro_033343 [Colocasia esculenta]|uniref:Uncharacterized protein n=1 Tax=Colocasia esculenta TaxID=4460 RepID=A0A843W6Q2_COLES|nr:hypothetical protein [Colocasia esculenta]
MLTSDHLTPMGKWHFRALSPGPDRAPLRWHWLYCLSLDNQSMANSPEVWRDSRYERTSNSRLDLIDP